ncbi:MAG: protein kinase, partial [Deltaproteobacteria bacterium]|nr:protein kinase [Deltaproteobacteria bacterium]
MSLDPASRDRGRAAERVGSYALVRRVGSGGMGEVWLGQHVVSGTLGAVKRVSPVIAGPVQEFFRREGRAIARLAHPHIVPVVELGDDFLVTSFIDGSNLARRLQTPIDPATAVRIIRQIASALAHAHERGVVHRDVKPSNILLDQRGNAYLADFGVATFVDEETRQRVAGTPRFMAPEQRRAEKVGPAADQYALGRTLLEMLVGAAVPIDPKLALAELPPHLPPELHDAIARATALAPEDRFPAMSGFADAVGACDLRDHGPPVRLAPEARHPAPFAWLAGALRVTPIAADLDRADFRLRDLVERDLLDAAPVEAFLRERGLADLGFTVWAATQRLGPLDDPRLLGRAAELAILMHGWGGTREVWRLVAPALCRDNAQAVVLTADLHGFGETPFAGVPTKAQVELGAMARAIGGLTRVLGIEEIPTALVGHSMAGTSLLTLADADIAPGHGRPHRPGAPRGAAPHGLERSEPRDADRRGPRRVPGRDAARTRWGHGAGAERVRRRAAQARQAAPARDLRLPRRRLGRSGDPRPGGQRARHRAGADPPRRQRRSQPAPRARRAPGVDRAQRRSDRAPGRLDADHRARAHRGLDVRGRGLGRDHRRRADVHAPMIASLWPILDELDVARAIVVRDRAAGLEAVIVIDDVTLGPAAGGV